MAAGMDLSSILGGLGMGQMSGGAGGGLMSQILGGLGMGQLGGGGSGTAQMDPRMVQGTASMMPPGVMPPGMGNQMPGMPGAGQLPGAGVQFPGTAQAQAGAQTTGGTFADILAGTAQMSPMQAMGLRMGPELMRMGQGQQALMQQPGALPVAGPTAQRNAPSLSQGYMAAGGGIAPRRIIRR